ncbi:MAG: aspartate--tRNA ligase [Candidatus Doudnabacteria bacterium]|nr:aspartate--tRNA ligase [Candidatus Doudnabacteria bacterium]
MTLSSSFRTHTLGELRKEHAGETVKLSGWVNVRRDHGGLIFLDLRDQYGITQVTFRPEDKEAFELADTVRPEWVVTVEGEVTARPDEMVNEQMKTGAIEVVASSMQVIAKAKTPPFEITAEHLSNEELRLKYRYLDFRRERMAAHIKLRSDVVHAIRCYMIENGFTEVHTPILANSSPEGARDFLVPSRLHPGSFYALPQAPQQFKQLLMVGGVDRYFQIAPCFRDEDPRADRSPGEFYQLDLEMAFVEPEDVFQAMEPLFIELSKTFGNKEPIAVPFPRITYFDAMDLYGSDRPDLRWDWKMTDLSEVLKDTDFKVFAGALEKEKGVVKALRVPGAAEALSRKDIDELTELVKKEARAGGLAYVTLKTEDGDPQSPIWKFLEPAEQQAILQATQAEAGDIVFFGADTWQVACSALGVVRSALGKRFKLDDASKVSWLWVTDFPMYERDPDTGKLDFMHNPFSMPHGGMEGLDEVDPEKILAHQYDIVANGFEISSGGVRMNTPELMFKAWEKVGYDKEEVERRFPHMIEAYRYGAPPHAGFAPGIDRMIMMLTDEPNIREVVPFPKDGKAKDPMTGAPTVVDDEQLEELHIRTVSED